MRLVALPVLLLLLADLGAPQVRIKLCGREFMRAIIYSCGASRWKREVRPAVQVDQSLFLKRDDMSSYEDWNKDPSPSVSLSNDEPSRHQTDQQRDSPGRPWDSIQSYQSLLEMCCKHGCTNRQIASLC
uniref:Relaxin-3-like n=1 Tax=Callorhinchus milii TaxID=7868 RepID=A0A4W3JYT5_CALMI